MSKFDRIISDMREFQETGELIFCPRCGERKIDKDLDLNSISRYANLYICNECGTNEALLNGPVRLVDWAIFQLVSSLP